MSENLNILRERVIYHLQRLINEGGDGNYLILTVDPVYIQFPASKGQIQIICEAVSNKFLPEEFRLNETAYFHMGRLGFDLPDDQTVPNFSKLCDVSSWENLHQTADLVLHLFAEVYHVSLDKGIGFELTLE